jgi:hypothetical protein
MFIGEQSALDSWLDEKIHWREAVASLASAATKFPQSAYSGLQRSLQQEWQFVQRVIKDIGGKFPDVEKELFQNFLPALFDDVIDGDDPRLKLACLPVKHAGLSLPNPVLSAATNYKASILSSSPILAAFRGVEEFRSADHVSVVGEVRKELKHRMKLSNDMDLASIIDKLPCDDDRTILRGKDTGQWLSVPPSTVNGTELSAQEFRDSILLRYARTPADLPTHCDGCDQKFSVRHALECKKGGLVISRHNEIRDELVDLASKALTPSAVRDEPRIHTSRPAVQLSTSDQYPVTRNLRKRQGEERGDVLIRGLWQQGTDAIIDVRITDLDAKSNISRAPMKVLAAHEREKKRSTWSLVLNNVVTSLRLLSLQTASLERKQRQC